ncbi:MAG TPA: hypothetical protein VF120_11000 [Ktedonobacterales bacterium]
MGTRRVTRRAAKVEEAPAEKAADVADELELGGGEAGSERPCPCDGVVEDATVVDATVVDAIVNDARRGVVRRIGYAPIVRLDETRREIELCATSEAVDSYGTIFSYEASKDAFSRWLGNVREMHERKAVGRRVAVRCDDVARKVYVTIRISLGARDTWEKVRDGTLCGASIGAANVHWLPTLWKTADGRKTVMMADTYDLMELSLVDNPSNPDALGITFVRDAVPDATVLDRLDTDELDTDELDTDSRRNAEGAEVGESESNHRAHRDHRERREKRAGGDTHGGEWTTVAGRGVWADAQAETRPEWRAQGTDMGDARLHAAARAVLESCGCVVCEAALAALADEGQADEGLADDVPEDAQVSRVKESESGHAHEARLARALEASLRVSLWGNVRRLDALDANVRAVRGALDESGEAVTRVAEEVNRMAGSLSETLASTMERLGELDTRLERVEAQPLPGGPAARAVEKLHPLHMRAQTAGTGPSPQDQYRALEALAGRLADPQAQIAVAAELIRLQREGS